MLLVTHLHSSTTTQLPDGASYSMFSKILNRHWNSYYYYDYHFHHYHHHHYYYYYYITVLCD